MARIRTVKPDFFTHPSITPLSIPARLLLLSLLTQADDEGRLYDQGAKIRGLAFGDEDRVNIAALLAELAEHRRILRYEAGGRDCVEIVGFNEHQRISHPARSVIPSPGLFAEISANGQEVFREASGGRADRLREGSAPERKGKERKGREGKELTPRERDVIADALAEAEESEPLEVPASRMRTLCVKANELRKVAPDVTPEEVARRAANWPSHMGDATITGPAVVTHWARLATTGKTRGKPAVGSDEWARKLAEKMPGA